MITTLIIEDEKKSSAVLQNLIAKHCPQLYVVGTADSVEGALLQISKFNPKLIFLDIQLSDGTGFDILEKVKQINFDVIFATAYDQFAIKAIKFSAVDYLLKPIDPEELKSAINKIELKKNTNTGIDNLNFLLQNFKQPESTSYNRITLPTGNAYEVVLVKDIIRCEANESYTKFYLTENRKFLVTQNLKNYEDILPKTDFIRVHHHHLINMKHVIRFLKSSGYVVMRDGSEIEVSRRKRDTFLDGLNKL